ncbi:hypothetical protein [Rossellomorea vietnamensis]|uniref:hypothetical protein n=1 Tax=Rossellomorea vietnamensis TaxID=218284 RepID=UPI001E3839EA|nr:hypothetical protein [Rossellomorea vietnamensis]MCC5804375.1 hypothetical protein [Rossellomorea vietnamensis]
MIDKATGSLILDDGKIVLNTDMSAETFMATSLYKGGTADNRYSIEEAQEINGKDFIITLFLKDGKLKEIHLSEVVKGLSWNNWTEDVEISKKNSHDHWLLTVLGNESYHYSWGYVESAFDKKGCVSSIILRYN